MANPIPTQSNLISRLSELDWSFHNDKSDSPFSDLHFHPGRFVPQIPAALIGSLTTRGALILDPFCGAGTTLVEAQRLGRAGIGIDLNPVSCLISRAKTIEFPAEDIENILSKALQKWTIYRLEARSNLAPVAPRTVQLNKWYHEETGAELCRVWDFICNETESIARDLLLFCFSAILMSCCAETRSWGYVCDNVRPLEYRYVDAECAFRNKLEALTHAYRKRDERSAILREHYPTVSITQGDAAAGLIGLESNSIDLVVTSPPYFGVVDYVKSQRLTMEWMGIALEEFRKLETGARSKRHRQTALQQYMDELSMVTQQLYRVLKPGAVLGMVVGESARREAVLSQIERLLRSAGFKVNLIVNRKIALQRRQPASLVNELLILAGK